MVKLRNILGLSAFMAVSVVAAPVDDAVQSYVDCLEAHFESEKAAGMSTSQSTADTFTYCQDERDAVATLLPAADADRVLGQIDSAARKGMQSAE